MIELAGQNKQIKGKTKMIESREIELLHAVAVNIDKDAQPELWKELNDRLILAILRNN
jgi:hypothetical protein